MSGYPATFLVFFDQNTMLLQVGLKDPSLDPAAIDSAVVSAQIKDSEDSNVGSPVLCSYVKVSDGFYWYEGLVPYNVGVSLGTSGYRCEVTAIQGGLRGFWDADLIVERRKTG